MKIYTLTSVSNSLSMGYLSYLACVESWIDVSDKVIVTDGWSDDGTLEKLFEHIPTNKHSSIEVIKDDITYWSKDYNFNISQLSITWNHVIQNVECDWLIVVNADYVYHENGIDLKSELEKCEDHLVVKFNRYKTNNGQTKYDDRGIILNIRKIRQENLEIGFCRKGSNRRMSDFPGIFKEKTQFVDSNNTLKTIYAGDMLSRNVPNVGIECGVYGHFFFTIDQCLYKCKRWSEAIARNYGTLLVDDNYLLLIDGVYREDGLYLKDEILSWKHPKYIKSLIILYLGENSLGMKKFKNSKFDKIIILYYRIKYKVLTTYLKLKGLTALENEYEWCNLDDRCKSVNLDEIYQKQNLKYKLK